MCSTRSREGGPRHECAAGRTRYPRPLSRSFPPSHSRQGHGNLRTLAGRTRRRHHPQNASDACRQPVSHRITPRGGAGLSAHPPCAGVDYGRTTTSLSQSAACLLIESSGSIMGRFSGPKTGSCSTQDAHAALPAVSPATSLLWHKNEARKPSHEPPQALMMVGPRQASRNQSLAYLSSPREASWVNFQAPKQAHALPRTPTRHCPPVSPATSLLWHKNEARKPSHEPPKWHHTSTSDSGRMACCGPTTISAKILRVRNQRRALPPDTVPLQGADPRSTNRAEPKNLESHGRG
jgi:hypothetical protein